MYQSDDEEHKLNDELGFDSDDLHLKHYITSRSSDNQIAVTRGFSESMA